MSTIAVALLVCSSCSDPERDRLKATTQATYDEASGRLKELTYDANRNGRIDTWTEMDGSRPVRSRLDRDEDGRIDRWEYYDAAGRLVKVGFSRRNTGQPDAWAEPGPEGRIGRVLVSSSGDETRIDRWETYDPAAPDVLAAVEEDTNHDGRLDRWDRYEGGRLREAAFDTSFAAGRPDRRVLYDAAGKYVAVEEDSERDGTFVRLTGAAAAAAKAGVDKR